MFYFLEIIGNYVILEVLQQKHTNHKRQVQSILLKMKLADTQPWLIEALK